MTELVFIIDKSGSMAGLESDTIGGFNATIKKHKKDKGSKAYVTTILFNTNFDMIHDRVEITKINQMKESDYEVGGSTALLDAVGDTLEHIRNIHKYAREEDVPSKTLFIIITDGMENASHKYSNSQIKTMISAMREERKWEFIFLGANIEAE
ncbi:MAG: VWA domain-containing protein, partial [Candidatus Riflebacteria bacterium]|nr:VWA domain-containing protein [Candidatus Riflebacteria bacterium]